MRLWIVLVALVACVSMIAGCDTGSDESGEEHTNWTFINDTGDADGSNDSEIFVARDGGPEWEGNETFTLENKGDERNITLKDGPGQISYRWTTSGGDTSIVESGNEIFFRN